MNYTLMHKDIPVADLTLDEATGSIQRIDALLHREHLPVGVPVRHGVAELLSMSGGRTALFLPAVPGCGKRWKPWEWPAPSCFSPAATA